MLTDEINTSKIIQGKTVRNSEVRDYIELLKPRVMSLAIFTAITGMLLVPSLPNPVLAIFSIIAIGAGAGAAGAINMWYDRDIDSLMERVKSTSELIVATDASVEGDATALYIQKILNSESIKLTRLARGLPVGGHLEYVDEATLTRSINERVELHFEV